MIAVAVAFRGECLFRTLQARVPRRVRSGIPPANGSGAVLVPLQDRVEISTCVHGGPVWQSIASKWVVERVDKQSRGDICIAIRLELSQLKDCSSATQERT